MDQCEAVTASYRATRSILRADTMAALQDAVRTLCDELGGSVLSAEEPEGMPIDISVGNQDPLLVTAHDPQARAFIGKYLPTVVADARFAAGRIEGNARWAKRATEDPLTGLWNRRAIETAINRSVAGDCLAVLDLDFFKDINDTHGHEVGDTVLTAFSKQLRAHCPPPAVVGRLGGEEFAIVMPRTAVADADRALKEFQGVWAGQAPLPVTFSAGVAQVQGSGPGDLQAPQDALRLADQYLYAAKNAGRNRIVTHLRTVGL